jgi:hypothetical protein
MKAFAAPVDECGVAVLVDILGRRTRVQSKLCTKCGVRKLLSSFSKHQNRKDGVQVYCRPCMADIRKENEYDKKRWADPTLREQSIARRKRTIAADREHWLNYWRIKAQQQRIEQPGLKRQWNIKRKYNRLRATPAWADMEAINRIYYEAARLSQLDGIKRNVDHIIPLKHKLVCGLHVENNLQILTKKENETKHNRFDIETTIFEFVST